MAYELQALIGSLALLTVAAAEVPVARVVPLAQGLALIPATPALLAAFQVDGGERKSAGEGGFAWHSEGLERRLAAWSKAGPIACVEAAYWGGRGTQRAAVWADGRVDLGPLVSGEEESFPPEGSPISQALRRIGARTEEGQVDEFATVGLDAHRSTRDWEAAG
ncbi:hypothetical protein F7Q99_10730 [Streptomyces kaniharaensis]|uniref:Uncharacterized protein n=1 Tax=Streptomyces kaniharaensis TaxID=212423 RepID=A0A6N7KMV7_9ACTN|nr:hypothetical protein [Streptomyces kaniharaensis]MQS12751.1 hypothetical protein [Streptomyces kaniharaensis]